MDLLLDTLALLDKTDRRSIYLSATVTRGVLVAGIIVGVGYTIWGLVSDQLDTSRRVREFIDQTIAPAAPNPVSDAPSPKGDFSIITERNIFGPLTVQAAPPAQAAPKGQAKSPLTLVGVDIVPGGTSSAIIEDPRKAIQDVFRISENIFGEAKLLGIFSDHVEIDRGGQRETLRLEEGSSSSGSGATGTSSSGEEVVVAESDVDAALANLPLLLTEIRAVPFFKEGQAVGLRLFAIKSDSLFDKIGLKNGDILKTINGTSLGDFTQAVKLFERLKSERTLKVQLERNREEREYTYSIR